MTGTSTARGTHVQAERPSSGENRAPAAVQLVRLRTPPPKRVVPDGVFDAFGWSPSRDLEWRHPADRWDGTTPIDGRDPARMVFVLRGPCDFLPRELACLHAFGLGLTDEEALAPWAIDDATDGLFERGVSAGTIFWLAADNLNALFWGLHDWAHFHHHGPFVERAWTELQCDATALAWLWMNRDAVPLGERTAGPGRGPAREQAWERLRRDVVELSRRRFADEGKAFGADVEGRLDAASVIAMLQRG